MSPPFTIKAQEHGVVRLFMVDLPESRIKAFADPDYDSDADDPPWALKSALGADYLDEDFIEHFTISDLADLGLPGYMTEGLGIAEADIAEDRAQLSALKGHLLIVFSRAFGGFAQSLTPRAPLRWVGTYVEDRPPVIFDPLPSGAATGQVDGPANSAKPSDAAISGRIAMIVLGLLGLFVWLLIWIAG